MTQAFERKLILIVDDTPTNIAVISGTVAEGLVHDEGRDQWREGTGARGRRGLARFDFARRDDAGNGRTRSLPAA